ncbi:MULTISPECIES: hypothetical protein [unclassified Streptomyces]|uniref:hypothetical protein n=1 Tax=unclassified Streptomyces TaxID=2593676 RepID=UPI0020346A78|nr:MULTISPECIES: hypothetical protein [unclassified Streptomyces]MCM2417467.1 hypothetical protein [Streptomyces sp. RKAG293]MCM2430308.1 hypothetical protein [Streptomyces sp. RKAG337]
MAGSADLAACDECGRTDRTVRDLGLRAPLALCDTCFRALLEVRVRRQPLPLSRILDDVRHRSPGHG